MTAFPLSTIKTAIHSFCVAATGLSGGKVIFAYQGGPEPTGSYVSIIPVGSIGKTGMFDENIIEDNADITVVRRRNISMQIDAYGPDAITLITAIYDGLDVPNNYNLFCDQNLSAMFTSGIRDLSQIKNIRHEQRYNIDITIGATYTNTVLADDIGWFNSFRLKDSILNTPDIIITGD